MSPALRRLWLQKLAKLFDASVITITFLIVVAVGSGASTWESIANVLALRIAVGNLIIFGAYIGVCIWILSVCGVYRSHRLSHISRRVREIFIAITLMTAIIFIARTPLDLLFATNHFLATFWLLLLVILVATHELAQQLLYYARSRGKNYRNVVIIGDSREASDLAERFERDSNFGYRVLDIIDPGVRKQ